MIRKKFPLDTTHLELLLAFEEANSLTKLSQMMCKDSSVISRQLQKLHSVLPVIQKEKGKWVISPLGIEVNKITRENIEKLNKLLGLTNDYYQLTPKNSILLIINAQDGLLNSKVDRSKPKAEHNISRLLKYWRKFNGQVIHIKHISDNVESLFARGTQGSEIMKNLSPIKEEIIIEKLNSSSFSDTNLEKTISKLNYRNLILTGFTANECIEATARDASELNFKPYVVSDATAMFDFIGPENTIYKAEKVHDLILANIHQLYAKVVSTDFLLFD